MLVDGQKKSVTWQTRSRRHYELFGYKFTKYGDSFIVPVEHLSFGSKAYVKVMCDYCGEIITKIWNKYYKFTLKHDNKKDSCKECQNLKGKETSIKRYGSYYNETEEGKKKILQGYIENYGVDNVSKLQEIKDKKSKTIKEHYGVDSYFQTDEFKEYRDENIDKWRSNIKLTKQEVLHILKLRYEEDKRNADIYKIFSDKVTKMTISLICNGEIWKDITLPYLESKQLISK